MLSGVVIWLNPFRTGHDGSVPDVSSFDDCVRAGYPVMESFPRQCKTPDGRNFVEQINGEQESGIRGMVLLGPTWSVISDPATDECADKPYSTTLGVTTSDQALVIKRIPFRANSVFRLRPVNTVSVPLLHITSFHFVRAAELSK